MLVTWTTLHTELPVPDVPWLPVGARWWQSGHCGPGRAELPSFDGTWWSVLATWDDLAAAEQGPPEQAGVEAWHVVLQPAAYRGDALLAGGARPFAGLPGAGRTDGASAVVTLAGLGADESRGAEFFRRFLHLGRDVATAPGNLSAQVQAPSDGAQLTFSAWRTLRDAVTWAYHQPLHKATVDRQEEHGLVDTSGFLRCAVLSSRGTLGDRPDPLAGITGTVRVKETA